MERHFSLERHVRETVGNGDAAEELVARSFYKILRRNGFTINQVITVAGFILDGLREEVVDANEKTAGTGVQAPDPAV